MIEASGKTFYKHSLNNKLNAEDRKISLPDNPISKECVSLGFYRN